MRGQTATRNALHDRKLQFLRKFFEDDDPLQFGNTPASPSSTIQWDSSVSRLLIGSNVEINNTLRVSSAENTNGEHYIDFENTAVSTTQSKNIVGLWRYQSSLSDSTPRGVNFSCIGDQTNGAAIQIAARTTQDSSTGALIQLDGRKAPTSGNWWLGTGTALSTRPLMSVSNRGTQHVLVRASGALKVSTANMQNGDPYLEFENTTVGSASREFDTFGTIKYGSSLQNGNPRGMFIQSLEADGDIAALFLAGYVNTDVATDRAAIVFAGNKAAASGVWHTSVPTAFTNRKIAAFESGGSEMLAFGPKGQVRFHDDNATAELIHVAKDSDSATGDLTIKGQNALSSASTNQDGGNLVLAAGDKASGGGTDGLVLIRGYDAYFDNMFCVGEAEMFSEVVGGLTINAKINSVTEGSTLTANLNMAMADNSLSVGTLIYSSISRGTHGSPTIVSSDDRAMTWSWTGYDGTDQAVMAQINVAVDGTPGAGDMPGRIEFWTTPDGSESATESMRIDSKQSVILSGRLQGDKGADVASADEITLGTDGNYFDITGTTTINHINKTDWQAGSIVVLQFDASVTVTHNAGSPSGTEASVLLAGAGDFSATANDTLTLIYDGTTWRELSRTVI